MKYVVPTNDPYARIAFAETYRELPDEFNYSQAPKYDAKWSNWSLAEVFTPKSKLAAEAEETRSNAALNAAIAKELGKQQAGMSLGTKIGIGVGAVAVIGLLIWAVTK